MRVKDVCLRLGQGTASLGLPRYYLLVEGPNGDGTDDVILEFKQARRSALAGLVPPSDFVVDGNAERISHAQGVHLVRGDRFYGAVELDGLSFMVRERAPYRKTIDLDSLSKSGWSEYAETCGRSLAHSHAMSDEVGLVDHDVEPEILAAVGAEDLFVEDVVRFAADAVERVPPRPRALPRRPPTGSIPHHRPRVPMRVSTRVFAFGRFSDQPSGERGAPREARSLVSDNSATLDTIQRVTAVAGFAFGALGVLAPRLVNAPYGMRSSTPETVFMTRLFGGSVAGLGALTLSTPAGPLRKQMMMTAAAMHTVNAVGTLATEGLSTRTKVSTVLTVATFAGMTAYGATLDDD